MTSLINAYNSDDNLSDAVLAAVNLGDDADTTTAICRQVAIAYYDYKSIPQTWLDKPYLHDEIIGITERLAWASQAILCADDKKTGRKLHPVFFIRLPSAISRDIFG